VTPLPSRAGVFGIARITWSWPSVPTSAAVVAPARTLRTSWPRLERRSDLATDLAEHLRLDPEQDDVGALDRSVLSPTTRMPYSVRR
jgi:hypothetical protein